MTKAEARIFALNIRKDLDIEVVSAVIIEEIISSKRLEPYDTIGIYYPLPYEINLLPLIDFYQDKTFCFPVTKKDISFHIVKSFDSFQKKRFNLFEPPALNEVVPDILLIPCVGINLEGKRLGYGKGYYDRYCASYKGLKVGICYKECILDFQVNEYDLKFDQIFVG